MKKYWLVYKPTHGENAAYDIIHRFDIVMPSYNEIYGVLETHLMGELTILRKASAALTFLMSLHKGYLHNGARYDEGFYLVHDSYVVARYTLPSVYQGRSAKEVLND